MNALEETAGSRTAALKPPGLIDRAGVRARVLSLLILAAMAFGVTTPAWSTGFLERAQEYYEQGDLKAAEIELKNALQRDPADAAARFLLGRIHLQKGDAAAAQKELLRAKELGYNGEDIDLALAYARINLRQFDEALRGLPDDVSFNSDISRDLLVARGEALLSLGKLNEAEAVFDKVLNDGPHVRAFVNKARLAVIVEDIDLARDYLDRAVAIDPNDPFLVAVDAEWYFRVRRFEEARDRFVRAAELDTTSAIARLGYIQSLVALGDLQKADNVTQNLLAAEPDDYRVILQNSVIRFLLGDHERAKADADRVLSRADRNAQALLIAGYSAFQLGQFEQAKSRLSVYLSLQPEDRRARAVLGATLLRLGYTAEAYKTLDIAESEIGENAEYLEVLTEAAIAARDQEAALKHAEQLAVLMPDDALTQEKLGRIRLFNGDVEGGIAALTRSLELNNTTQRVYVSLYSTLMARQETAAALDVALKAQKNLPDKSLGFGLEGGARTAAGDMAEAEMAFRKAVEIEPMSVTNVANLARFLALDGRADEARSVFREALSSDPDNLGLLLRFANLEAGVGDEEHSIRLLREAVERHPQSLPARLQLSNTLLRAGDLRAALEVGEAALRTYPQHRGLLRNVGLAQLRAESWSSAIDTFQRLRQLQPNSAEVEEYYGLALEGAGKFEDALRAINEAQRLGRQDARLAVTRARLLVRLNRIDEARAELARLKATNPDIVEVNLIEGQLALAGNEVSAAAAAFERAFEQDPNNFTLRDLARARLMAGRTAEALGLLREWLSSHPSDLAVHNFLAGVLISLGAWDAAEAQLKAILEIEPEEPVTLNNLAMIQLERDNAAHAVVNARKAVALAPDSPALADTLGLALIRSGQPQEAVSVLTSAQQLAPASGSIGFHLAQAQAAAGDVDSAVATLRQVLRSDAVFPEKSDAEALLASLTQ